LTISHWQSYPGRLHLCVDGWTSPNVIAFLGATVHWVVDGRMESLILDFIKYVFHLVYCVRMLTILLLFIGLRKHTLERTWQLASQSVSMTTEYRTRFLSFPTIF
jgi:putative exporter of polyketide antibiotics